MATNAKKARTKDWGRVPYRFTADQVWKMIDLGILPEPTSIELWDGIVYKMTRKEPHNFVVAEIADAFRAVMPDGHHVREEKSNSYGQYSLAEPDVALCRGGRGDYLPNVPDLSHLAIVVEVNHSTGRADSGPKLRRYAAVGIPVYWIVDVMKRRIRSHGSPQGLGRDAAYGARQIYREDQFIPIVVDGREVGRVAVDTLLPPKLEKPS